jgi:hypothetical protein
VPLVGVSSPAMIDSSVLLPEPEAPTMAASLARGQAEIDIAQNVQRAGGIGDRLEDVLHRNDGSGDGGGLPDMKGSVWFLNRRHFIALRPAGRAPWVLQGAALAQPAGTSPAAILVVGDSLSAEYGLARGTGWVALLEKKAGREKIAAKVVNASISGDTTAGGRSRLPALLASTSRAWW